MFRNYLKTSLRFFANNRSFSLLNIAGLSMGTLCCIYILIFVRDQYSYDRSFPDAGRIYRVTSRLKQADGSVWRQATTPPALAAVLDANFSARLSYTQISPTVGVEEHLLIFENSEVHEREAYEVDRSFFDVFRYRFVAGSPDSAFRPGAVILSRTLAEKLFGKANPIGRDILVENNYGEEGHVVSAVVEPPGATSIQAGIFFTLGPAGYGQLYMNDGHWMDRSYAYTFVKLNAGVSVDTVEKELNASLDKGLSGNPAVMAKAQLELQPIRDIHTSSGYDSEMGKTVSGFFLAIVIGIAILIQLIACINFMNMATARASKRAKEVGVRKIIGAGNKGLVVQFLVESCMLSLAAVLTALPLLITILPWVNEATGADIPRTIFAEPAVWCLLLVVALVTGLLAGSYPAFYLSDFQAARVIKGDFSSHISVAGLRRALVVFQFILSIVLIVGMIVMRQQLHFIKNKDLGFNTKNQLIVTFHTLEGMRSATYFTDAIRQFPNIIDASLTDNYPGAQNYLTTRVYEKYKDPAMAVSTKVLSSDEYFLRTMGIRLISGRDFQPMDTGWVLINESLVRALNLDPSTAPGKTIISWGGYRYTVAGVMKDFNYESLHETVAPFMVRYKFGATAFNHLIVSTTSTKFASLLPELRLLWKQRIFIEDFDCRFLSDDIQLLYRPELIMSRMINSFTLMAMIISCLGLFGLAAFNAEQRTKEIGIRKVMGASVTAIVRLLSTDFLKLICVSFLLGVPIAWWVMNQWLNAFIYHIQIPWWTFGIAGGVTIITGMTVVSWQAAKAAVVNPVESLRAV